MTSIDLAAAPAPGQRPWLSQCLARLASTDTLVWLALALVWGLGHSYAGIEHDARIYMGRALADLDPNGVGRDMMFALDGQSSFTAFRVLAKVLVSTLGLGPATALLTVINLIVWFAAIVVLVRSIVPGRAAVLVLLVAVFLPRVYTPLLLISAGESVPIPRPLAEAGVLLAVAALCRDRIFLALGCLVAAALFHPIMAAPGFALLGAVLVRRDKRWLIAAAIAAGALLTAAAFGVPVVSRLFTTIDPTWRDILLERNFYLWMRLWQLPTYGMIAVQVATILIACAFVEARARFLMICALVIGGLGCMASFVFGDLLSSLLVVQAQLWRALWLPAVLAPVAAGICVWQLPACGRSGQITLGLLALAWLGISWMPLGPLAAVAALVLFRFYRDKPLALDHRVVLALASAFALMALCVEVVPVSAVIALYAAKPIGVTIPWSLIWSSGVLTIPGVLLAVAWWRWRGTAAAAVGAALVAGGLACLAAAGWDSRIPAHIVDDSGRSLPGLRDMMASRPGEVLWLRHDQRRDEVWTWIGRPNWTSMTQGGSIVFSRELALKWKARTAALVEHRLAWANILDPWHGETPLTPVDLAKADLAGFCRRADAPVWIVVPITSGHPVPDVPGIRVWNSDTSDWTFSTSPSAFLWTSYDRYGVIPCARESKPLAAAEPR